MFVIINIWQSKKLNEIAISRNFILGGDSFWTVYENVVLHY